MPFCDIYLIYAAFYFILFFNNLMRMFYFILFYPDKS